MYNVLHQTTVTTTTIPIYKIYVFKYVENWVKKNRKSFLLYILHRKTIKSNLGQANSLILHVNSQMRACTQETIVYLSLWKLYSYLFCLNNLVKWTSVQLWMLFYSRCCSTMDAVLHILAYMVVTEALKSFAESI